MSVAALQEPQTHAQLCFQALCTYGHMLGATLCCLVSGITRVQSKKCFRDGTEDVQGSPWWTDLREAVLTGLPFLLTLLTKGC